jgi:hypothetical protein
MPIACRLLARGEVRRGPWNLGRASTAINVVALLWIAICGVLFVLPPNLVAGYTFAGLLTLLAAYWYLAQRHRFKGPPSR